MVLGVVALDGVVFAGEVQYGDGGAGEGHGGAPVQRVHPDPVHVVLQHRVRLFFQRICEERTRKEREYIEIFILKLKVFY